MAHRIVPRKETVDQTHKDMGLRRAPKRRKATESDGDGGRPGPEERPNLYKVGCVGRITQLAETGDGRYLVQLTGIARFRLLPRQLQLDLQHTITERGRRGLCVRAFR